MKISEIVKNARHEAEMSQEELSTNICAVETLSRIECSRQIPHFSTYEALMLRTGHTSLATRTVYDQAKRSSLF